MLLRHVQTSTDCSCYVQRLIESMDDAGVDVIVYPTWSNVARLVGDYITPDGAPQTYPTCIFCSKHPGRLLYALIPAFRSLLCVADSF